jgi:hypothetical protein
MKDGWAQKHKWEQPFRVVPISSLLNCFSRGVRLRLSWLAAFRSLFMLSHFERFTFQPIAFGFCLLQHRLPAVLSVVPFGSSFRDGEFYRIQIGGTSLAIRTSHCMGTLAALQLWRFPGNSLERLASFGCFSRS